MKYTTISGLARTADVSVETVRYYQRRGLLGTPERAGGIRRYGETDVRRLRFVRLAQAAGFTLEQIGELIELDAGEDRDRARHLARTQIAVLDGRIAEMVRARKALAHLADACGATTAGPCPIITAFDQA